MSTEFSTFGERSLDARLFQVQLVPATRLRETQAVLNSMKRENYSSENSIPDHIKRHLGEAKNIGDFLSLWLENRLLDPPHQEVFDKYYWSYRRHFGQRMREAYSEQIREAIELIKARPGARVLEIGFGLGTESLWLSMQGANVVAIDILGDFKKAARRRKEILEQHIGQTLSCEFRRTSIMDLDDEEAYDVIWMEQTFHHLEPREAVVDKIVSLIKPGGHLVVSEVNAMNPLMQFQLFLARGTNMYFTHVDEEGKEILIGRERIITAHRLKHIFAKRHVYCKNVRYFRIFPNHPMFDKFGRVEKLLAHNWLAPLQTHFNYVGRRKE
jgi:2-polyprenyl-3-methyl-5-hydroxy-6-metoxy-1,4-benzoquinol methylase